jgi:predicted GNAT superfamily acetyltransferase
MSDTIYQLRIEDPEKAAELAQRLAKLMESLLGQPYEVADDGVDEDGNPRYAIRPIATKPA